MGWLIGALLLLASCSHSSEEDRLLGTWEGTMPLPATGEPIPISYSFRADGLTVVVGLGPDRTVTEWEQWEVHAEDRGDLILHVHRADQRVFATLARFVDGDELLLWDLGTDIATAAHVRRVAGPGERGAGEGSGPTAGGTGGGG